LVFTSIAINTYRDDLLFWDGFTGFSLDSWKSNNSLPPDAVLTDKQKDELMQQMGLNHFLLKEPCEIKASVTGGILLFIV
jgi:hypothetical protein